MKLATTALAVFTALAAGGCRSAPVRGAQAELARALVPVSDEKQLGAKMVPEIEAKTRPVTDATVVDYIRGVGGRVAAASPNPDDWTFTFKVLDDPKTVNAFAIPGGTVYVYSGLIKTAQNEAQLAGVLAHEVAHVTSRHIAQRLVAQFGLETVASMALGQNPSLLAQVASAIAVQGTLLKNSRDDESEADAKSVVAAARAGYDPRGLPEFLQILLKEEGSTSSLLTFLSDHPATQDRIKALNAEIASRNLKGDSQDVQGLRAIQQRL